LLIFHFIQRICPAKTEIHTERKNEWEEEKGDMKEGRGRKRKKGAKRKRVKTEIKDRNKRHEQRKIGGTERKIKF
jgi:hypothetical protein